jgi:hypothetical protein
LINLGGYDAREFGELHRYVLVVATDATMAKQRGKAYIDQKWQKAHTDRVLEVDDCLAIDCVHGRYIHLVQAHLLQIIGKIPISLWLKCSDFKIIV